MRIDERDRLPSAVLSRTIVAAMAAVADGDGDVDSARTFVPP
jgi:hypothetical protein